MQIFNVRFSTTDGPQGLPTFGASSVSSFSFIPADASGYSEWETLSGHGLRMTAR
jgi:hypothetical protein